MFDRGRIQDNHLIQHLCLLAAAIVLAISALACQAPAASPTTGSAGSSGTALPPTQNPVPSTAVQPTLAPTGSPQKGGTLVVAASTDPGHLNPAISTSGALHFVAGSLYNGLVGLTSDFQPEPELADSWEVLDGGMRYRFKLHPGVRWHDGKPFTSADVEFTFNQLLLKYHSRTQTGLAPVLAGIDTPDDLTVVFRFKKPYAPLLQQLNVIEAPILPKQLYEGSDPMKNPANLKPVGTGPFRFVE